MSKTSPGWVKPVSDYGPIAVFFVAYVRWDLMVATAAVISGSSGTRRSKNSDRPKATAVVAISAAVVGVFGGLTLWLADETFIKLKPTIVQGLIAAILLGGLAFGKALLKPVMGAAWPMDDAGWRRLTLRFALFFAAMAVLNEIVWRTQSTDFWVSFKVFGILGLTFVFSLCQMPLLNRHHVPEPEEAAGD